MEWLFYYSFRGGKVSYVVKKVKKGGKVYTYVY